MDGWIILKWALSKHCGREWIEFIWLKTETGNEPLGPEGGCEFFETKQKCCAPRSDWLLSASFYFRFWKREAVSLRPLHWIALCGSSLNLLSPASSPVSLSKCWVGIHLGCEHFSADSVSVNSIKIIRGSRSQRALVWTGVRTLAECRWQDRPLQDISDHKAVRRVPFTIRTPTLTQELIRSGGRSTLVKIRIIAYITGFYCHMVRQVCFIVGNRNKPR